MGILLLGVLLKLFRIGQPLGGNFASYQAGYWSIAWFYLQERFTDLFHPKILAIVGNAPGLRMLDFPICSLVAALAQSLFGGDLIVWGRIQAIIFSTGTTLILFRLSRSLLSREGALASALAFTLSPLSIIYGRSFLNDAGAIFFGVFSIFCLISWKKKGGWPRLILSALSFALAILMRIHYACLLLPLVLVMVGDLEARCWIRQSANLTAYLALSLVLPSAWYAYTYWTSRTSPHVFMSAFFQVPRYLTGQGALFLMPEFYVRLFDNLTGVVLTPLGFAIFLLGLLNPTFKERRSQTMACGWLAAVGITLLTMPRKYHEHEFYLWHFVPPCALFIGAAAKGFSEVSSPALRGVKRVVILSFLLILLLGSSLRYAINPAFTIPKEDWERLSLAREIQEKVPREAKVVVVDSGYLLLAYLQRLGWPFRAVTPEKARQESAFYYLQRLAYISGEDEAKVQPPSGDPVSWLEYLRKQGASYLVVFQDEELRENPRFRNYLDAKYLKIALTSKSGALYDIRLSR